MPIGIPTICWYTMSPNCTYIFSMRKVKASLNSVQVQHLYESYVLLEKNPALSEVQRYVFDSLFQNPCLVPALAQSFFILHVTIQYHDLNIVRNDNLEVFYIKARNLENLSHFHITRIFIWSSTHVKRMPTGGPKKRMLKSAFSNTRWLMIELAQEIQL